MTPLTPDLEPTRPAPGRPPTSTSVVIPVRNGGPWLAEQLTSLVAQTHTGKWELIMVDNGSTDDTVAVAESFADRIDLKVVPAHEQAGINYARNTGIAASVGELIVHCDADDIAEPGWLDALVTAAADHHLVGGRLDEEILNQGQDVWRPRVPTDRLHQLDWLPFVIGANLAVWREALDAVGGWNEEFVGGNDDLDLSFRIQLDGWRIGYCSDAVIQYRHRAGLGALFRQFRNYGRMDPLLHRDFRAAGHPPSTVPSALKRYVCLVLGIPSLARGPEARGEWTHTLAFTLGRLEGSLKARTLYL
ncbi:MAG: glycosyltransferase [Actinomycetia bacterium]|nr:glycosyltransferase [Actinomycetes bacterium]